MPCLQIRDPISILDDIWVNGLILCVIVCVKVNVSSDFSNVIEWQQAFTDEVISHKNIASYLFALVKWQLPPFSMQRHWVCTRLCRSTWQQVTLMLNHEWYVSARSPGSLWIILATVYDVVGSTSVLYQPCHAILPSSSKESWLDM